MSPFQFYVDGDDSGNANNNLNMGCSYPPPLGVSRVSHCIKKSSSSSSSSSASSLTSNGRNGGGRGRANDNSSNGSTNGKAQHRHPVIIYTHSPKIIQTNPRDFMVLVQKLTGLSQSEDEDAEVLTLDPITEDGDANVNVRAIGKNGGGSEDTDASSVVTEEYGISSGGDHGQVNSCFTPLVFDRPDYYNFSDPALLNFIPNNNISNTNFRRNDLGDFFKQ